MRMLLFGDLHLDTTFAWAPREVARARRANLRRCLRRIVELAEEVDADVICSAGDLYEHEHVTPDTETFVFETLSGAGRDVVLVPGNHDPLLPGSLYAARTWPAHVHVATSEQLTPVDLRDGFRLWCGAHQVTAGTPGFLTGFTARGTAVHYALFHGSEERSLAREGERKQPHAPFRADQIPAAGLDHALVGHFHTPEDGPHHTYPGNPDPLAFGEQGERAAVLIDVAEDGTPWRQRRQVAVSRVADVVVDVEGATTGEEIVRRVGDRIGQLDGQVRVTLEGDLASDVDLQPGDLQSLSTPERHVVPRFGRIGIAYDLEELAREQTVRGQFVRDVRADEGLDEHLRRRVLLTGLRALDGRDDLEVR